MSVPQWFMDWTAWAGDERWVVAVFLLVLGIGVVDLVQRRVLRHLERHARGTQNIWDDVVVAALGGPVSLLIWVLGLASVAAIASTYAQASLLSHVGPARTVGLVVAVSWFGVRLARGIERGLIERYVVPGAPTGPDRTTIEAIGKLLRAAVVITGALVALQSLGFSVSGVIAFGGIGGIAVGFAARDLLANFFGSIMIHLDRPFAVDDWIRSPDREIEGTVEYIGWRLSRVRTFDMRPLYVPNSVFASVVVENPSRMSHRRIYEIVGVRYADVNAVAPIVEEIRAMLDRREDVDSSQPLIVNLVDFGASALDLMIYCLVRETRWVPFHAVKQEVMLAACEIIERHGARIALPTQTVHLANGPGAEAGRAGTPGGEPVSPAEGSERATARGAGGGS